MARRRFARGFGILFGGSGDQFLRRVVVRLGGILETDEIRPDGGLGAGAFTASFGK